MRRLGLARRLRIQRDVNGSTYLALWLVAGGSELDSDSKHSAEVRTRGTTADHGGDRSETPWIRRWRPERNIGELGVYGGVHFPSPSHELYAVDEEGQGLYEPLKVGAGVVGGRAGYYPLRFLGIEAEGGAAPTQTRENERVTLWHARGGVVGQLPFWSVAPFATLGAGALGARSDSASAVGNDTDAAIHFGGGVKIHPSRHSQVRIDVRDVVAAGRGIANGVTHSPEILVTAALVLGRAREEARPAAPKDSDGDGFIDPRDRCPNEPGVAPDGCPVRDSDGDGVLDPDDECPTVPGVAPHGCPPQDRDRDSFLDEVDACPDDPGIAPDGCPLKDRDGDGILDPDDRCIDEPENRNGFEDADGCPDEIPPQVKAFTGVIEGIHFEIDKATIRPESRPVLQRAAKVLREHPDLRIGIVGHTDSTGGFAHNMDLSRRRADAVREWLEANGIDGDRLVTRGAGPNEPIADNATKDGRQKNRRIEFHLLTN